MSFELGTPRRKSFVRLLEVDPELGAGLDGAEVPRATKYLLARTTTIPAGSWDAAADCPPREPRGLGVFVVDGLLTRRVDVRGGSSLELIGAGDIIRPWDGDETPHDVMRRSSWTAVCSTEIAWLDGEFAAMASRWPEVGAGLIGRTLQRIGSLSCHLAISHIVGVEVRILCLISHLAERWGRVTREGVLVPIPLTNEMVGTIIGARAPSVSTAVRKLANADLIMRRSDGTWLLHHRAMNDDEHESPLALVATA